MKPRPSRRSIWAIATLLLVVGIVLAWWYYPRPPACPPGVFFPDNPSIAVRLVDSNQMWMRHWIGRTQAPDPDAPVRQILKALGTWDRWAKKFGEAGARLRQAAYKRAISNLLGDEAWLILGEWTGGKETGTGQVGMVLLVRSELSAKTQVGPLVDLVMEDYKFQKSRWRGVPMYEYVDKKIRRSLTFCQMGGWICASMRQRGSGPLPQIINQYLALKDEAASPAARTIWGNAEVDDPEPSALEPSGLRAVFFPSLFFGHLRQFAQQRNQTFSIDAEQQFAFWQQRLEGIKRVTLAQTGDSLLDLKVVIEGRRLEDLAEQFKLADVPITATPTARDDRPTSGSAPAPGGAPGGYPVLEAAQLDLSRPLAQLIVPLAGFSWDQVLEETESLDRWAKGLREALAAAFESDESPRAGRVGLGVFVPTQALFPSVLFWEVAPGREDRAASPASAWVESAVEGRASGGGDRRLWIHPFEAAPPTPTLAAPRDAWRSFEDRLWSAGDAPLLFVGINFETVAEGFERIPDLVLKKKARERLAKWRGIARALALGVGGSVLRLDADGASWIIANRTIALESNRP